ncbi:methyltransferase domain-containing protein [Colletotrichum graminicola M1.001]|uniref:Methyltransferase domain-containing protein n=1 Tax=Colletotrichum graminicola (strain M1.001 / M2 / FGSC 10212) TaxID=645133 RepID=E3QMD8_COLGM|nr:methyltransferase domain-containing protein [Colletotrichum graminicola M1.001]EFQ32026.1 methyltransferase domain-containing protein [Colletotrichum graminicola M1.001]
MSTGGKPGSRSGSRPVTPQGDSASGEPNLILARATLSYEGSWGPLLWWHDVAVPNLEAGSSPTTGSSSTEQTPVATSDAEATTVSTEQVAEAVPDPAPGISNPTEETPAGDALEAGGLDDEGEFTPSVFDEGSIADDRTDSTSLNSSVFEHSFRNGRRYHKFRHGRYPIPNDETEQNREDMLHTMMLEVTDGRLYFAPIGDNPQKIIDLGTGTGIWAIEMGDLFPSAEIHGLDLSPIQPIWVPPNVKFLVDDVEDTWLNGSDFDFVHLRNMVPVLKSPVNLLRNAYEHMKPGGWVELQDVDGQVHCDDGSLPPDWPLVRFTNHLVEAFAKFGTNSHAAVFGRQYLEEAGFVNIRHHTVKLPYGTWPKDKIMRLVGMYYRTACEEFFPAVGAIHFEMLGWSKIEMEVLFAQCRNAMRDPNVHAYGMMHFWSGQKPA